LNFVETVTGQSFTGFVGVGGEEFRADERSNDAFIAFDDLEFLGRTLGEGGDHRLALEKSYVLCEDSSGEYFALSGKVSNWMVANEGEQHTYF
jgi:hypothetical protein